MLFKIDGEKLRQRRGDRSLRDVARASGNAFSDVALWKWEREKTHPSEPNVRALVAALNCDLEEIVRPFV